MTPTRAARGLLALAAVAVSFAAADTYVVVLALPDMMASAGLSAEDLHRAASIISGFMLGYVAMLPLAGRIADLRGRVPVLVGALVLFSLGSLVTALAYDLPSLVTGRVLQGAGAGGLLPATLALVADLYPPRQRGLPLGLVGAVQELGNVIGPVYGALVLAVGSWRTIFWINLAAGLALAAAIRATPADVRGAGRPRPDWLGLILAGSGTGALVVVLAQPARLAADVTWGLALVPVTGSNRWLAPLALAGYALLALLVVRCATAAQPLVDLRAWGATARRVDVLGATLLAVALGGVILAFGTANPQRQVFAEQGPWLLLASAVAAVGFVRRNRVARHPLLPSGAIARTPAWGALVVSFFVGAALVAALIDIPIFARLTVHQDDQVAAAMVLVRFLVGLPIGAFVGGWLTRRLPAGVVTAVGMALSCGGFLWMATWDLTSLDQPISTVPLVLAGFGVGLAMAPVNAALLAATDSSVHGVASGLLIVSRTIGKLVGISALTTIGLRRFYATERGLPAPADVCSGGRTRCAEWTLILREAGLTQLHTIFVGAAVCCVIAGLVALVVFRTADTRAVKVAPLESWAG
ncbi:MFS transporter [Nocardioides pelophilus]|uniref:MFS transporter n=1 Tax=Nocardioides pelophilus TaxID=2172019 RepID=UPI00160119E4|nr:MFS transporter [Nocardioides pelophilus]